MKQKLLCLLTLLFISKTYCPTQKITWIQNDEEKPKQAYDYFIGQDDQIKYVSLSDQGKKVLKKMLDNSDDQDTLDDVIKRVRNKIRTNAGKEAFNALREIASNADDITVGVVKDGIFNGGKMMKKGMEEAKRHQAQQQRQ